MSTLAKPKTKRLKGRSLLYLAVTLALVIACVMLYVNDGGSGKAISELSGQIATQSAAQEQLDTLQGRLDKRVTQLEEAQTALDAAPGDEALTAKLTRAQAEYEKALKNRDQQLSKMEGLLPMEELNVQISQLKAENANHKLAGNLLIAAAIATAALFVAHVTGRHNGKEMLGVIIPFVGGAIVAYGMHRNNLASVATGVGSLPGTTIITIGLGVMAVGHVLYWILLAKQKLYVKTAIGAALVLGGAALAIVGILDNNSPDAASRYINAMSPGFPKIFLGAVMALLGTAVLAFPLEHLRHDLKNNPVLVLMVLPSIAFFLVTAYLPMVGVYFAFTSYQFTTDFFSTLFGSKFIGLANFEYLFSSGLAWRMTFNTLIYNFIFIVGGTVLKVAIAIMFSEIAGKYYKKCVQTVTFLPHFISMVMVGTFAYNLLNYNSGVVNSLLVKLGLDKIDFYSTPNAWYVIIPLVDFWKGLGYGSIIYVSAITGISDDLYEAADLDGANFMQEILHITIPSIRPTIVILTLMSLGSIMKGNFDLFYQLVGEAGQLMETTEIIDTYVWRSLRQNVQIGMGSAAGLYQSFVGMVLVMVVNAIVKKIEPDYAIF